MVDRKIEIGQNGFCTMAETPHVEYRQGFMSTPAAILVGSILISVSILLSSGIIRIKGVTPNSPVLGEATTGSGAVAQASAAPAAAENAGPVKVSLADSPVLGDKKAKLTMVEFSDYECPFCKRYYTDTYSQLKKDYVDTGKMKIVFRNLPLSFHQNAHKEAQAALCARDQGGDTVYWKYHDEMFTRTTSNGTGLSLDQLPVIAKEIGLNGDTLKSCIDSGKYVQKVDKDLADAGTYGATGTPSFFIGKDNGDESMTGTIVVGAQPFSAFKALIDQQLAL